MSFQNNDVRFLLVMKLLLSLVFQTVTMKSVIQTEKWS